MSLFGNTAVKIVAFMRKRAKTYELPATQWAAVTTQFSEMRDPPQMKLPYRCNAI